MNSGSLTITKNGAVVNGMSIINHNITVEANNVTIENSRVACNCPGEFAVIEPNGYSGLTIKDSEVSGGNIYGGTGSNTYTRLYMWNCDECIQYDANITDSYLNSNAVLEGAHYEPVFNGDGATNIQHSVLLNPHEQTAAVIDGGPGGACVTHLTVNSSLLAGGGYMIYPCANDSSAGSSATVITNNRFARCTTRPVARAASGQICRGHGSASGDGDVLGNPDNNGYYPRGGFFGVDAYVFCSQTTWKNNVWDDGGTVAC